MAGFRAAKKSALFTLFSLILIFSGAGCGKKNVPDQTSEVPDSAVSEQTLLVSKPATSAETAARILKTYEQNMSLLSPYKQGHWMLRLYRTSGDLRFFPVLRTYARLLQENFRIHIANLATPGYAQTQSERKLELPPAPAPKKLYRVRALKKWGEMAFANRLLYLAFQIKSFGLHLGTSAPDFLKAVEYFRTLPFRDYVLDPQVILYDASHTTNAVFYLKYLGLGDLEEVYVQQFRKVFATPDEALDTIQYSNKIYGMTHIIIGASYFYQRPVPADQYAWILDYFIENIDKIKTRVSPDALAEILVCFRIARLQNDKVFQTVRETLLEHFDAANGIVLSKTVPAFPTASATGDVTALTAAVNALEHRNVMSYLAFSDFVNFYPGPNLSA